MEKNMKKIRFGTPEEFVPSRFCAGFSPRETDVKYPIEKIKFSTKKRGCTLILPLDAGEQIYGLGLQLKCFNLRGRKLTIRPQADPIAPNGESHAPVPFFVSSKGYGIYVDTARYAEFYFGSSALLRGETAKEKEKAIGTSTDDLYRLRDSGNSNISIHIPAAEGVDIYIFEGENITDVVSQYNMASGGGCGAPEWALEAMYRCPATHSQDRILEAAEKFERDGFHIGTIGLEPGWMTHSYSDSFIWNKELYPDHKAMIKALRDKGYHLNLWEHAFVHPTAPFYNEILPFSGNYSVWGGAVPDFATDGARKIFADYHKKLVELDIDGFKLDECDGSDLTGYWSFPNMAEFPSGLDGEQYHSLFGTLYMQTILDALGEREVLSEVRNAGALAASYPFVLYSDLYDHPDFIRGNASAGFSGLLWSPEVRDATSGEDFIRRLEASVFSVQCVINAWFCETMPWLEYDCEEKVKELLCVRHGLVPLLKAAFDRYKKEGIPPVRALVCDYTDDPQTHGIDDEYIFCDSLLVAPIASGHSSRRVYLPEGKWVDYFTKEPISCGWHDVTTDGIPVYEKIL